MRWGSVHEATACLCALNYFHGEGVHVAECGMFPGESLLLDVANQSIPNDVQLMDQLDSLRKLMDSSRLNDLGWHPRIALEQGLQLAYADFKKNASSCI